MKYLTLVPGKGFATRRDVMKFSYEVSKASAGSPLGLKGYVDISEQDMEKILAESSLLETTPETGTHVIFTPGKGFNVPDELEQWSYCANKAAKYKAFHARCGEIEIRFEDLKKILEESLPKNP